MATETCHPTLLSKQIFRYLSFNFCIIVINGKTDRKFTKIVSVIDVKSHLEYCIRLFWIRKISYRAKLNFLDSMIISTRDFFFQFFFWTVNFISSKKISAELNDCRNFPTLNFVFCSYSNFSNDPIQEISVGRGNWQFFSNISVNKFFFSNQTILKIPNVRSNSLMGIKIRTIPRNSTNNWLHTSS